MRIVIDIAEEFIDKWGCIVVEPTAPTSDTPYVAPKVSVPCFVYRVPQKEGDAVFSASVGPIPAKQVKVEEAPKTEDGKPALEVYEENGETPAEDTPEEDTPEEDAPEEDTPDEAVPSEDEQGGEVEPEKPE